MHTKYKVAIIGASGLVGLTVLKVLEEKAFSNVSYMLFSSNSSAGNKVHFLGEDYVLCELSDSSFNYNFDYAIFCAGSDVAEKFAPIAVSHGTTVIDNSSFFRMNPDVPLIVPEVNINEVKNSKGIISNPNCSTIQAMLVLKPLDDKYKIKRIVYSTYQAVSGAGKLAISDLETKASSDNLKAFPYPIYNNCIPQIDSFTSSGYTKEELKMINETRKILGRPNIPITATCVRVPVVNSHSESINIEFENDFDIYDVKMLLQNSPGVLVVDNIEKEQYPLATKANGYDEVFVGRIRKDYSINHGLNLWVVADNLRKGAATNAVQILEYLINN
ncbi:MAG: aspartate-semialdehyde dehydrogenase [Clostridia bacterium]